MRSYLYQILSLGRLSNLQHHKTTYHPKFAFNYVNTHMFLIPFFDTPSPQIRHWIFSDMILGSREISNDGWYGKQEESSTRWLSTIDNDCIISLALHISNRKSIIFSAMQRDPFQIKSPEDVRRICIFCSVRRT